MRGVFAMNRDDRLVARIGYDLFGEVRTLLTAGQPARNASLPGAGAAHRVPEGLDHRVWNFPGRDSTGSGRLSIRGLPDARC